MWPSRLILDWALTAGGWGGEERQRCWIPKREPQFTILTADQAVPRCDPKWDPENDKDEWTCNHCIHCVLAGLRRAKIKTP
jgi:hypothetical protein